MEKETFVWNLAKFSSRYRSNRVIDPDVTATTLCKPYPCSPIFTTGYGSFTAKWILRLSADQQQSMSSSSGANEERWSFQLHLMGTEANLDNSEPRKKSKKRKLGAPIPNVKISVKCQLFLVEPKKDDGAEDDSVMWSCLSIAHRYLNPPIYSELGRNCKTVNLGWPHYKYAYDGDQSDFSDMEGYEQQREHGACSVSNILKHINMMVNPAENILRVRAHLTLLDIKRGMDTLWDNLARDLGHFLGNGQGSDVIIKCGSHSFPAHKLILSIRSPVFRAMFQTDMQEAALGIITIEDSEPRVFRAFLAFLYTAKVELSKLDQDQIIGLIAAADKYDVSDLKYYCFQELVTKIDKDGCGKLAVAAHLHRAEPHHKIQIYEYNAERWKDLGAKEEFKALVKAYPEAFLKPEKHKLDS